MNQPAVPTPPPSSGQDSWSSGPRQVILLIAGVWFLYLALPAASGGSELAILDFLRGLALGLALLALGLIRWSAFRGLFGIG